MTMPNTQWSLPSSSWGQPIQGFSCQIHFHKGACSQLFNCSLLPLLGFLSCQVHIACNEFVCWPWHAYLKDAHIPKAEALYHKIARQTESKWSCSMGVLAISRWTGQWSSYYGIHPPSTTPLWPSSPITTITLAILYSQEIMTLLVCLLLWNIR